MVDIKKIKSSLLQAAKNFSRAKNVTVKKNDGQTQINGKILYLAKIKGTLFLKKEGKLRLDLCLTSNLLNNIEQLPEINSPFIYIGGKDSIFGLHMEDMGLFSISYLHDGEPKMWFM